ncbi:MAG: tetratricopeptide repeat protein [Microcoleaceae cyanobacterium]
MDYSRFTQQLSSFSAEWRKGSTQSKPSQFQQLLEQIGCEDILTNLLQLLNNAITCLEPNEVYCEIGTQPQGATLIGALLNQSEHLAYVVGSVSNPQQEEQHLEQLISNLQQFGLEEQVVFCGYDFEEFLLEFRKFETQSKIGVFFYTGETDYRSVLVSLLLVQSSLASQALILMNWADQLMVRQAVWDFLAIHPEGQVLLEFPIKTNLDQTQPEILILSWDINRTENYPISTLLEQRQPDVIFSLQNLEINPAPEQQLNDLYQAAITCHEQGELESAKQIYQNILELQPDHAEAWLNLGILHYDFEDYEASLKALVKSAELEPSEGNVHYYIGLCLEKMNQLGQAISAYQKAIELEPSLINAYNNLGNIWYQRSEFAEAEMYYRAAIATSPYFWGSHLNLGNILLDQHRLEEAIEAYQTALKLQPEEPLILKNLEIARFHYQTSNKKFY